MSSAWSGIWVVAIIAFVLGHFGSRRRRQISLIVLILSPIAALALGLAAASPLQPGYLQEWLRIMWLSLPWLALWTGLAIIGYSVARWSVR